MRAIHRIMALGLTLGLLLAALPCALGEEEDYAYEQEVEMEGELDPELEIYPEPDPELEMEYEPEMEVDAEPAQSLRRLRLGTSFYTVMIDDGFVAGDMTEEEIAEGQIGCYVCDRTGLELDVFEIGKEDASQELAHATMEEANKYDNVEVVWPSDTINDIEVGWFRTHETWDGVDYDTVTYILDAADNYIGLEFWIEDDEDDDDAIEVWTIMDSLRLADLTEIQLGTSPFALYVPDDFREGSLTAADIEDDQVAYWYSEASLLDFDVYQFSKEGQPETLAAYVEEEAATYPVVTEVVTDAAINDIPVAWYRCVDECEEGEYDTITYVMDDGEDYVEVVFWLDGLTADAEADYIIHNLHDSRVAGEDDNGDPEGPEAPEGVTPVTWDVSGEHLMIEGDEARELYERIVAGDYPTLEELKTHPVVQQLDALAAYYKELYGNTANIDTPERDALRQETLDWFLSLGSARTVAVDESGKHTYAYDGPLNRDFQMLLALGLPASGKSTFIADPQSEAMGAFILDPDVIKAHLPEYVQSHGAGADAVHFEGMALLQQAIDAFLTGDMKGVNIVLPIVGGDLDEMMQQFILPFEAAGYDVRAAFRPAKENEAAARVVMRELAGGQLINSAVAFNFGDGPENVYNQLKDMINSKGEPYGVNLEAIQPAA